MAIFNNLEDQHAYLSRSQDDALLARIQRRGERALLWLGRRKLVLLSTPPPHLGYLRELGYDQTTCAVPANPSWSICQDILAEQGLMERIVEYAGRERSVQLVPYVTTAAVFELAARLEDAFGLTVLLPESPRPINLWVRDYADSKAGFRLLVSAALTSRDLPEGYVCHDAGEASAVARWFAAAGRRCIAKADRGNSGYGHTLIEPGGAVDLAANPFLREGLVVVEELVDAEAFPSVEVFVPAAGRGDAAVTYTSVQIMHGSHFAGVTIEPKQRQAEWYDFLVGRALQLAGKLQAMGYVGHLDLDAAVARDGSVPLLEVNARRTGGTHAHEFAVLALGRDYARAGAVICHSAVDCPKAASFDDLRSALEPVLYPIDGRPRGVVITNTPVAGDRAFGCIIAGNGSADARRLERAMLARV